MTTMEKRHFGSTDLEVSAIGLGTWPMGGARYGPSDDQEAERTIQAALDAGITCFDSAPSYGNGHAEELLGRGLRGHRDEAVIVTKGGLIWNDQSEVSGRDSSFAYLVTKLGESLTRLNTDYVDLFLIHWPDAETPSEQVASALQELVKSGKTRYVGVSNFSGERLREVADAMGAVPLAADQVSYHLFDPRWETSSFETCKELGIGVMAYGSLAHGLLTGSFAMETTFEATDWRAAGVIFGQPLLTPENRGQNLVVVDRLKVIAGEAGMSLPQLAIAWVLSNPVVTVALVGARVPAEIEDSAVAGGMSLDTETLGKIDEAMAGAVGLVPDLLP